MHPHTQRTGKSKHLGSFLASPLLLLFSIAPPRAFGFYLSCVQAQASVKPAEEISAASALSSGWETHASITWNIELLGPFCVFDPQQMDGEAGDNIQHHTFLGSHPKEKNKNKNPCLLWKMEINLSEACVSLPVHLS